MTHAVFAGLDDLDWAAMRHAYGSAAEVPDLLRGLIDRCSRPSWPSPSGPAPTATPSRLTR